MTTKTSELKIEDAGFFTPGKGISQMMISLFIWVLTGIIYKLCNVINPCVKYELVCFLSSLILSILSGIMINRRLLKNLDVRNRFIYGVANILLLYTSSNGMQAAYCVFSEPDANEKTECASIIPFIEARPWLPDLYHTSIIQDVTNERDQLKNKLKDVQSVVSGNNTKLLNDINSLREENLRLRQQLDACSKAAQATQVPVDNNSSLYSQIEILRQRIIAFNTRQSEWVNHKGSAYDGNISPLVLRVTKDPDFYNFLFYTPIDATLFIDQKKGP